MPITWAPMERALPSLHMVAAVKLRIATMHNSGALGISGIELWAQPLQRLPRMQRDSAWRRVRQAAAASRAQQPAAATLHTDSFTGLPLDSSQAKPDLVLQQRIRNWLASHHTTNHFHQ
ncbi:hypothetical protein H4R19_005216 [Coemansia spiralis]|nr:hypothetical protein H4R19_005216 [Coemansia spiralis]